MKPIERKSFDLEIKEMNDKTGEVAFYFAGYKKDLDEDIINKSSYDKTLAGGIKNVYHNRDHEEVCGKPLLIETDDKGAFCVSQLAIKTIVGNDVYEQYKAGIILGHSQEFQTLQSYRDATKGARVITELKLWGVTSVTTIPAYLDTPTISIKSAQNIVAYMQKVNNMLHNGNASDMMCEKFLSEYKKMETYIKSVGIEEGEEIEEEEKTARAPWLITKSMIDALK